MIDLEKEITKMLGMSILKGPVAAMGIPENPGLSVFSIIDFSHISIHTFTETNEFYLDIFSCKPFDYEKLEAYIKQVFKLKDGTFSKKVIRNDS